MNKDFWGFLFYYDKLSVALNTIVSSGSLWIYQEDLEGFLECYVYHDGFIKKIWRAFSDAMLSRWDVFGNLDVLGYCAYLGGMPLVFRLCAFTLDGSSGPFMLGLRVVGPVWLIFEVRDLGGTFDDFLFHLLPLFQGMCFHSWSPFLKMTHFGPVPI